MKKYSLHYCVPAVFLAVASPAWTAILLNENFGTSDGGFTASNSLGAAVSPWMYDGIGAWSTGGENAGPVTNELTCPAVVLPAAGVLRVSLAHRYSFEATFDGGAIQYSVNSGAWQDLPQRNFVQEGYVGAPLIGNHPLLNKPAFHGNSTGYTEVAYITSVVDLPPVAGGASVRVRFLGAWDANTIGTFPNWEVDSVVLETLTDTDGDTIPDAFEDANGLNKNVNDAALDADTDGSTNLQEYIRRTNVQVADTDGDGFNDGAETATGIWVGPANTGTDPFVADTDGDGLRDGLENPSQASTGLTQPGSDPNKKDTDNDTWDDYVEVAFGADPKLPASKPTLNALPLHLLAWWNFNDASQPARAVDAAHSMIGELRGSAVYSADALGFTGSAGDRALDLGTTTSAGTTMAVKSSSFMNLAGAKDQVSISYWQKLYSISNSYAFHAGFTPVSGDTRALSAHATWSNSIFYFDTAGCCAAPSQRMQVNKPASLDLTTWHHIVFQKNGPLKEIWVDGVLLSSSAGAAVLPANMNSLFIGSGNNGVENTRGLLDEVAIFSEALTESQIQRLFNGDSPVSLLPTPDDADGDGMLDAYEDANGLNKNSGADRNTDLDSDGLTNFQEFVKGTRANVADTDGDGLSDGVETGTNSFVSAADTGTDALDNDSDNDGLLDGVETGTGIFVSLTNTGTNPTRADSDADSMNDRYEITVTNSNPSSAASPVLGTGTGIGIAFTGSVANPAIGPSEIAGFANVSQTNWNVTTAGLGSGSVADIAGPVAGSLVNAAGVVTPATVNWFSPNVWNATNGSANGNSKVMNGYLDSNASSAPIVDITGIPYAAYDLYVYFGSDGNGRTGSLQNQLGERIHFVTASAKGTAPGFTYQDYLPTTATAAPGPASTFAVFRDQYQDTLNLQLIRGNSNSGIHAIQIVPLLDSDSDGMPDRYEDANALNKNSAADKTTDADSDTLTNYQEFTIRTNPNNPDSDGDGFRDNVETATGTWVSPSDTGSHPLRPDSDNDGLRDGLENPTLPTTGLTQPGSDPNLADTDSDSYDDYVEAAFAGNANDAVTIPVLDAAPVHLLAWWPFNDATNPAMAMDVRSSLPGQLLNGVQYTADAAGRTGLPGDRAMDVTAGQTAGKGMRVGPGSFINIAASRDQFSISFWQKLRSISASTVFKGYSASASGTNRGMSFHATWSDNNFYFDTAGCCTGNNQRISIAKPAAMDLLGWRHFVFQKNGELKELWVDGVLLVSNLGSDPLPVDFNQFYVGGVDVAENINGLIDDFAFFAEFLTQSQIQQLAAGAAPSALVLAPAPRITGVAFNATNRSVQVSWVSNAGKQYRIERSADLTTWQILTSTWPATGAATTYTDSNLPGTATRYFYRLAEMP